MHNHQSGELQINNVNMSFTLADGSCIEALKDISLRLKKGELISILGPSGCGKSTLLNIIAGFLSPSSGSLSLNNHKITKPNAERGMVFQQGALFEWMNVTDNIAFGPKMKGLSAKNIKPRVEELLQMVGLEDFAEHAVYSLSGGMQQRVALARCLANEPDIILMDEPLGALDALTREKMQSLILKLWQETGTTIILITHSVEEALLLGERVLIMAPRPGRILKTYQLPFAKQALGTHLRDIKKQKSYQQQHEEILSMIWDMEEDIMGKHR